MAIYPCDQHGARYRGPQRTAYPAVVNGGSSLRERRRLCPDCFTTLRDWASLVLFDPDSNQTADGDHTCCGGDHDGTYLLFLTLYPGGEERVDLYGRVCAACLDELPGMLLFGRPTAF